MTHVFISYEAQQRMKSCCIPFLESYLKIFLICKKTHQAHNSTRQKNQCDSLQASFNGSMFTIFASNMKNMNRGVFRILSNICDEFVSGLSMNISSECNKSPVQRGFFKNSTGDLLPALRFLGGLYKFCNFVIIFSLM